jgi:hypothetical protein
MAKKWLDGNVQVLATKVGGNLSPGIISVKVRYPGGVGTSWLTMRIEDYRRRTTLGSTLFQPHLPRTTHDEHSKSHPATAPSDAIARTRQSG